MEMELSNACVPAYESPRMEAVEMDVEEAILTASSGPTYVGPNYNGTDWD